MDPIILKTLSVSTNRISGNSTNVVASGLSDDVLDSLFELVRKVNSLIGDKNIIEAQARVFKVLRQNPSEETEYILGESIEKLKGEGVNLSENNVFLKGDGREPIRLGDSLWLCHSYNLPARIKDKVDKGYNGFYLLDTRLIDPDERLNSDGVVRLLQKKEYKLSDLKENEISSSSRLDFGHKAISISGFSINITEPVNISTPAVKPIEESPLEKLGLSIPELFNSLKSQLQDPEVSTSQISEDFRKVEDLLVNKLKVRSEDFLSELQNTMVDFVNSSETAPSLIIDRKDFFFRQNLYGYYTSNVAKRINNDINTSGAVTKDDVSLIKHFDIALKNSIYKNHIIEKAKSDFEYDLKDDSNKDVNLISKFILDNYNDANNAGAERGEFGKIIISMLVEVANSDGISSICLEKCRKLGERYHVMDDMPEAISVSENFKEALPEPFNYQDINITDSVQVSDSTVKEADIKVEEKVEIEKSPVETKDKFPFTYNDYKSLSPAETALDIYEALQDELIAVLEGNGDMRVVLLIDAISKGKPMETYIGEIGFSSEKEARAALSSFLQANKLDPNLTKALIVSNKKSKNIVRREEIKCPAEKLFELVNEDGSFNSRGHVTSLKSEIEGIKVQYDESGSPKMVFDHSIPNFDRHETSLASAVDLLLKGELVLMGPPNKVKMGGLYVENKANINDENGSPIALVCIHGQTNSRVWGSYYASTGELILKDIAKDHNREWNGIIQDHQKIAKSQRS